MASIPPSLGGQPLPLYLSAQQPAERNRLTAALRLIWVIPRRSCCTSSTSLRSSWPSSGGFGALFTGELPGFAEDFPLRRRALGGTGQRLLLLPHRRLPPPTRSSRSRTTRSRSLSRRVCAQPPRRPVPHHLGHPRRHRGRPRRILASGSLGRQLVHDHLHRRAADPALRGHPHHHPVPGPAGWLLLDADRRSTPGACLGDATATNERADGSGWEISSATAGATR